LGTKKIITLYDEGGRHIDFREMSIYVRGRLRLTTARRTCRRQR